MQKDLNYLFQKDTLEPEPGLLDMIMQKIELESIKRSHRQKIERGIFYGAAILATIASGFDVVSRIIYSDFSGYFSLFFSDTKTALSMWHTLSLSLIDSLPLFGISLFMGSLCLLIISAKKYANRPRVAHFVTI